MAKSAKCIPCKKILSWPMNVRLDQMLCPDCLKPLSALEYGDLNSMPAIWYSTVAAVQGKFLKFKPIQTNLPVKNRRRR